MEGWGRGRGAGQGIGTGRSAGTRCSEKTSSGGRFSAKPALLTLFIPKSVLLEGRSAVSQQVSPSLCPPAQGACPRSPFPFLAGSTRRGRIDGASRELGSRCAAAIVPDNASELPWIWAELPLLAQLPLGKPLSLHGEFEVEEVILFFSFVLFRFFLPRFQTLSPDSRLEATDG